MAAAWSDMAPERHALGRCGCWSAWPTSCEHAGLADQVADARVVERGRRSRATSSTDAAPPPPWPSPAGMVTYGELWSIRSWNIHRMPTVQPSSTSPMRSLSGTRTSVRNSWQNSLEPFSISMRCTSMPGLVDREHEHGEAAVLRHVPVGAGQAQAPVRPPGAGGPDLRPVEHPLVAVADGRGQRAGDVGAAARLGEELHPDLLALEDGGEVALLLLLGAEVEQDGRARREGRRLEPGRVLVADQLLVERPLVGRGEALAAVGAREADAGEAGVEEHALELAVAGDLGELLLVGALVAQHPDQSTPGSAGARLARIQVRARSRKVSTSSIVGDDLGRRSCRVLPRPAIAGDPPPVLASACRTAAGRRCGAAGRGGGRARRSRRCRRAAARSPA